MKPKNVGYILSMIATCSTGAAGQLGPEITSWSAALLGPARCTGRARGEQVNLVCWHTDAETKEEEF